MTASFALLNLGGGEVILILALALILFGSKELPEMAKGLGEGHWHWSGWRELVEFLLLSVLLLLTAFELLALIKWLV